MTRRSLDLVLLSCLLTVPLAGALLVRAGGAEEAVCAAAREVVAVGEAGGEGPAGAGPAGGGEAGGEGECPAGAGPAAIGEAGGEGSGGASGEGGASDEGAGAATGALAPPLGAMLLVVEGKAVLAERAEMSWSKGKVRWGTREGAFSARVRADRAAIPAEVAALVGARVIVHAEDGGTCVGEVGAPFLFAAETGEFVEADGARARAMLDERAALMAEVRGADGRPCPGIWARRAELPAPRVFVRDERLLDDLEGARARALAAVQGAPELAELAAERAAFLKEVGAEAEPWEEAVAAGLVVERWQELGGERALLAVEVRVGEEICSTGFFGERAFLFEAAGEALVRRPRGIRGPSALVDLERDDHLEAVIFDLAGWRTFSEGPGAAALASSFEVPFLGCPC